jgi:hypothetical protein
MVSGIMKPFAHVQLPEVKLRQTETNKIDNES